MTSFEKLGRILGATPEALSKLDAKMSALTGRSGVMDSVAAGNDQMVDKVLADLGLSQQSAAEEVYNALTAKLIDVDKKLFELLDKPDLAKLSNDPGKIASVAFEVVGNRPKGLFIKKDKVAELLAKMPPQSLLEHFGYGTVQELLEKEGFASVVSALRFTQTTEWMHQFFETAYNGLTAGDFEEREVEIKVLNTEWLKVAEKFMEKKFHNVSHLKEFGVTFIIPLPIDMPGETLRMFTLLMHYLHEVPFYAKLFRRYVNDPDFVAKFQSLLRGDVPEGAIPEAPHVAWRIVQRYLAKDGDDPRLHEHHVNPEAEHWYQVAHNFQKVAELMSDSGKPGNTTSRYGEAVNAEQRDVHILGKFNIDYWTELDHVGDFFPATYSPGAQGNQSQRLVSFDVVDLIMSLAKKGETKYLYHQQEALWNKIFSEYMGREQMNWLIEDNIIGGFIKL